MRPIYLLELKLKPVYAHWKYYVDNCTQSRTSFFAHKHIFAHKPFKCRQKKYFFLNIQSKKRIKQQ